MARDRFTVALHCPGCGRAGEAKLSQADGWAYVKGNHKTTVEKLSNGFKVVDKKSGFADIDFFCDDCDVCATSKD